MPLERVQQRFDELAELASAMLATHREVGKQTPVTRYGGGKHYTVDEIDTSRFVEWKTSVQSLLSRVFGEASPTYTAFVAATNDVFRLTKY